MSKKEDLQLDLFPEDPKIKALGISTFKIKEGEITGQLTGICNKADIALIDVNCWRLAVAEWLVELCGGHHDLIQRTVDEAEAIAYELKRECEIMAEAMRNATITKFPSNAHNSVA